MADPPWVSMYDKVRSDKVSGSDEMRCNLKEDLLKALDNIEITGFKVKERKELRAITVEVIGDIKSTPKIEENKLDKLIELNEEMVIVLRELVAGVKGYY